MAPVPYLRREKCVSLIILFHVCDAFAYRIKRQAKDLKKEKNLVTGPNASIIEDFK
jgi:hypothetical protein